MPSEYDVVVVGAGPAGSAAALVAARAGLRVLVVERGERIGAKNVTGGMLLARELGDLIPNYEETAPLERPVRTQNILMASGGRSTTIAFSSDAFADPPYNGITVLRRPFDQWMADQAREAGATIVIKTVVDDLLYEGKKIVGIRARRDKGEVRARVVILADGVNSLLAEKAGLKKPYKPHEVSLGVKELLGLPLHVINERFGLIGEEGKSYSVIGDFIKNIPGGGFVYTNKESVSVGVVVQGTALDKEGITADEALERFKAIPEITRLIKDSELIEYSAHLIPEGGRAAMPEFFGDGVLVAGDAAGFVVNTGLTLQGINLAISSGKCAGETAVKACKLGDTSASVLKEYEVLLKENAALSALEAHPRASEFMALPRMTNEYPAMLNTLLERMVTIEPGPQKGILDNLKEVRGDIRMRDLLHDLRMGVKSL